MTDLWRLIRTPPAPGAWNMALDEAFLLAAGRGLVPPTLRLYAWQPPCLSLGFAQPTSDVDQEALQRNGWSLVRRPTGGRAILHTDELTYSVTGPHSEPRLAGSVLESYRVLSRALLRALLLLEIPAEAQEKPHPLPSVPPPSPQSGEGGGDGGVGEVNPICFEVPSNYEITVSGKKLVGSAQSRRKEGVLQHGSLPLYGDLARITQALVFPDEAARQEAALRLLGRAATAEQVLGRPLDWETAAQAFASAFEQALQLKLETGEPTEEEMRHAERLVVEKYANIEWTERV